MKARRQAAAREAAAIEPKTVVEPKKKRTARKPAAKKATPKTSAGVRQRRLPLWMAVPFVLSGGLLWFTQPWSQYSPFEMLRSADPRRLTAVLRSFDEILPSRPIRVAEETRSLDRAEAPIDAGYEWNGAPKLVESFLEEASVTGLFVLDDGEIVHERYRLGADAQTRFTTFALADGVVAALIGAAQRDGLIESLDDTAETYARRLSGTAAGATSLRDLLAMSAGTNFVEDDGPLGSDTRDLLLRATVLGGNPDRLVSRTERVHPPGEMFDYASSNTQALAAVVAEVNRKPLAFVVEEKIWRPFGMSADASWSQNRAGGGGVALGFCCWNATLQDIARFGEILRRGGAWGEARLLPDGWIEAATETSAFAEPGVGGALGPWGYGLHVYVPAGAQGEFLLAGEYGQYLWVDRRRNTVVAMTAADPGWRDRREEATAVMRAIVATVEAGEG